MKDIQLYFSSAFTCDEGVCREQTFAVVYCEGSWVGNVNVEWYDPFLMRDMYKTNHKHEERRQELAERAKEDRAWRENLLMECLL